MRSVKKRLKKKIFKSLSGRRKYQRIFRKMHELSLAGLGFGIGENIEYSGEKNVIACLDSRTGKDKRPVIFDIGSNIGSYAREVLEVFGERARVYCFEPQKRAFTALSGALKACNNVKVYNFGFSDTEGKAVIYGDNPASPLASVFERRMEHLGVAVSHKEDVTMRKVDNFCAESGISGIDLMKIDTEGAELSVLKGAKSVIGSGKVRMIQFEFGPFNIASRTFFQDFFYLLNPDFRIYRVLKDGFEEVDSYKEAYEIFLTTNYLALSRKEEGLSR